MVDRSRTHRSYCYPASYIWKIWRKPFVGLELVYRFVRIPNWPCFSGGVFVSFAPVEPGFGLLLTLLDRLRLVIFLLYLRNRLVTRRTARILALCRAV